MRDYVADLLLRLFGGHAVTTEVRLETPGSTTVVAGIALQTGAGLRLFYVAIPNPAANSALARQSDTTSLGYFCFKHLFLQVLRDISWVLSVDGC